MSAYSDLIVALAEHPCCFSDDDAKKLVDAFAHELAEKIRQDAASRWAPNGKGVYAVGVEDALEGQTRGADLIDPEAQKP